MSAGRVPPAPVPFYVADDDALRELESPDGARVRSRPDYAGYSIPGTFYAEVTTDGAYVLRLVFTPAAGAPGYGGRSAEWEDGAEIPLGDDAGPDELGLWPALRRYLAADRENPGRVPLWWIE